MRARLGLLITGFLVTLIAACGGDDPEGGSSQNEGKATDAAETIKIGVLVPLSGGEANTGADLLNSARLAADELNAAGGVLGRQIEIVSGDDGCDPDLGRAAAEKMLSAGVVGVTGGYCSGPAIPESAVFDTKSVPFIAGATNPAVTERGLRSAFRISSRDDLQAEFAARFLAGSAGAKKLAILHDNTVYAKGLAELTRTANDELNPGLPVVFFDAITPGETDYRPTLTAIRTSGADSLYFTGYSTEAAVILRQAKELALPVRVVGADAANNPAVIERAGAAADGFVVTTAPLPEFLPRASAFTVAYSQRFGASPGPFSVYEYDSVKALVNGIFWAGSTDPKAIVDALKTTRYEGVTGEIAFDAKGDRQSTLYTTAMVRDGKFRPHKKLDARGNWVDG